MSYYVESDGDRTPKLKATRDKISCTVNKTGERLLYPKATTFWIAVGKKLVDFFGGSICYNDCGDQKPNYTAKKPRRANNPSDGEAWDKFQDEIFAVKPITQSDLDEVNEVAAYKLERA